MKPNERWATEHTVTLQRHAFERVLEHLPDDLERLAIIRAAYDPCSLAEAREILCAWRLYRAGLTEETPGHEDGVLAEQEAEEERAYREETDG